jgi:hypothetical protein
LQNNPNNISFKKVNEMFDGDVLNRDFLIKSAQVVSEIGVILAHLFTVDTHARTFINTRLWPLVSSKMQLNEAPVTWLFNRLHATVEQRQQTLTSRSDLKRKSNTHPATLTYKY